MTTRREETAALDALGTAVASGNSIQRVPS